VHFGPRDVPPPSCTSLGPGVLPRAPAPVEPLLALLPEADREVRGYAIRALEQIAGLVPVGNFDNWQAWWQKNKSRYLPADNAGPQPGEAG
jgi:hypothetical protein